MAYKFYLRVIVEIAKGRPNRGGGGWGGGGCLIKCCKKVLLN